MRSVRDAEAARAVAAGARRLQGASDDFDLLLDLVGDASVVLLGEATHGTHDFYRVRAEITKRLIREKGFRAVAVEADWPDAYRVNRYVRCRSTDGDAEEALRGFIRFPQWMWRNADVLDFVGWLRDHNADIPDESARVGCYGLDLYSLHASMAAVLDYLRTVDPEAAERAARRYACFDHFGPDPQAYGYAATLGLRPTCEQEVIRQLVELRGAATEYARRDGRVAADAQFFAERNAQVAAAAEQYYRTMFQSRTASWNLRDRHMAETLEALQAFLGGGAGARIVVWAHNSHLGDARATEMGDHGELNLGQLVRQRLGAGVRAIGFTTHGGTVTAASDWEAHAEQKVVRPALAGSYEALFHEVGVPRFWLDLRTPGPVADALADARLERAIGVIYRPDTERQSHYFFARLSRQFDAVLHYDRTRAVEPLERTPIWERGANELPETYPTAL